MAKAKKATRVVDETPEPEGVAEIVMPETGADLVASDVPVESEHARLAATPAAVVPVEIPIAPDGVVCTEQRFNEVTGRMDRFDASGNQIR